MVVIQKCSNHAPVNIFVSLWYQNAYINYMIKYVLLVGGFYRNNQKTVENSFLGTTMI